MPGSASVTTDVSVCASAGAATARARAAARARRSTPSDMDASGCESGMRWWERQGAARPRPGGGATEYHAERAYGNDLSADLTWCSVSDSRARPVCATEVADPAGVASATRVSDALVSPDGFSAIEPTRPRVRVGPERARIGPA